MNGRRPSHLEQWTEGGQVSTAREGTGSSGRRNAERREKGTYTWERRPTSVLRNAAWEGVALGWGLAIGLSSCHTYTPVKRQRPGKLRLVKRSEVWVCATPLRNSVMLSWSLTASFFTLISAPHLPTTSLPRSMWLASWYHCFPTERTQWRGWFCIGEGSKYRRLHPRGHHRAHERISLQNRAQTKTRKRLPLTRMLCSTCIVQELLLPRPLCPFPPHTRKYLIFW